MTKGFVKRSQFQTVSLTDATTKSILIEGDEAYISVMNSNGNTALVRRQVERDSIKAITASTLACTNTSLNEFASVDFTYGRVSLDSPNVGGTLQNHQITTTAGVTLFTDRIRSTNVGFKEYIDIKANNTTYPLNVLIEVVTYVPSELIMP